VKLNEETWALVQAKAEQTLQYDQRLCYLNHQMRFFKEDKRAHKRGETLKPFDFMKENFWGRSIPN